MTQTQRGRGRHIVLIGLMGCGKTTVGEILAARHGRELLDSDRRIETLTGRTVKQILGDEGVDGLRRHEGDALLDALRQIEPAVIAAAGGTVLRESLRRAMIEADAEVVWLNGAPTVLAARVPSGQHRPWIETDPEGTLTRMFTEREALYRQVADRIVAIDGLTANQVADLVWK